MDEKIYIILKLLFEFALEVWFSIYHQEQEDPQMLYTNYSIHVITLYYYCLESTSQLCLTSVYMCISRGGDRGYGSPPTPSKNTKL